MKDLEIARKCLDTRLAPLRPAQALQPPPLGWMRALREALGMTTAQLALRLGISQPGALRLEQSEAKRTITLASLDKAARALGCTLVYALVPNRSLDAMVIARAEHRAAEHVRASGHSMRLEDQDAGQAFEQQVQKKLAGTLLRGKPSRLWDSGDQ